MKQREYLKSENRNVLQNVEKGMKAPVTYLQQILLVYQGQRDRKVLKTLSDKMFRSAFPLLKNPVYSALGSVQNSNQIKLYPYGNTGILKFDFKGDSRTVHLYNTRKHTVISITDRVDGDVTVSTSTFQLIQGIADMENNWKKLHKVS